MGKKSKKWKPLAYTADDVSVEENIAVQEEDVREMLTGAHGTIEKTVAKLNGSSNLDSHPFYFLHANAFVLVGTKMLYPCEMAVLKFSLRKGIEETYHTLINPGSLPVGFAHDAQLYSQTTHRVPYPPLKEAESQFSKILFEVQSFMMGGPKAVEEHRRISQMAGEEFCLPPMYTFYDKELFHYDFVNEAVTFDLMQKLTASSDEPCRFLIHPLAKLFFELQKTTSPCDGDNTFKWMSLLDADEALQKDSFLYTPMLGCKFHEQIDAPACCSLSLVKRWALTISRYCSGVSQVPPQLPTAAAPCRAPIRDAKVVSVKAPWSSKDSVPQEQSSASQQVKSARRKFLPRSTPVLRQPYASIQDVKPIP